MMHSKLNSKQLHESADYLIFVCKWKVKKVCSKSKIAQRIAQSVQMQNTIKFRDIDIYKFKS